MTTLFDGHFRQEGLFHLLRRACGRIRELFRGARRHLTGGPDRAIDRACCGPATLIAGARGAFISVSTPIEHGMDRWLCSHCNKHHMPKSGTSHPLMRLSCQYPGLNALRDKKALTVLLYLHGTRPCFNADSRLDIRRDRQSVPSPPFLPPIAHEYPPPRVGSSYGDPARL